MLATVSPQKKPAVDAQTQINLKMPESLLAAIDEWVADINKRGGNGKAMLDDARAMIKQYTK